MARSLPDDPTARLTDVLHQMLTEQRLSKQISPHLAKSFINHADRGFDDKRLRNSCCGASGFQPYVNSATVECGPLLSKMSAGTKSMIIASRLARLE
jgi:hypothetical protein